MGRRTRLTPEIQKGICEALNAGNYFDVACEYCGVPANTGWEWLRRGEGQDPDRKAKPVYDTFAKAVRAAEAKMEVRIVAYWQQAMPENWQAGRDFLARRKPARWANREKHEITDEDGDPIPVSFIDAAMQLLAAKKASR